MNASARSDSRFPRFKYLLLLSVKDVTRKCPGEPTMEIPGDNQLKLSAAAPARGNRAAGREYF